jgi:hypothetical protein
MNHANCDAAVEDLKTQADVNDGKTLQEGLSYYSIRGSVVAFVCETFIETVPYREKIAHGLWKVTKHCGEYVPGTYWEIGIRNIGYMNWHSGLDFCGHALEPSATSC